MNNPPINFPPSLLENITGGTLFYPCAGADFEVPISVFATTISEFIFVDRGYFSPWHQDTRYIKMDRPADRISPVMKSNKDLTFIDRNTQGMVSWDWQNREMSPCTLTEEYLHEPSNRRIFLKFIRDYGRDAFRKQNGNLSVFFYRGDSMGEGGSGDRWFSYRWFDDIMNKLTTESLLVTDGSQNLDGGYSLSEIWKHANSHETFSHPSELIASYRPFTYRRKRFTCIGYTGDRYGPTMVWHIQPV